MNTWRQTVEVARLIPSEFELWVHRRVLAAHRPDPTFGTDRAWCGSWTHRPPDQWPCDEFIRADRAVDAVLERRASR